MKPIPSPSRAAVGDHEETEPPALALERFLPYRLSVLTNVVSRAIARLYDERLGLSIPEWRVMAALGRYRELTAGEICGVTAMDKVQVSRAVGRMQRRRLLKSGGTPADRRRRPLRLSRAGEAIYAEIVPLALARERHLLAALGAGEALELDR